MTGFLYKWLPIFFGCHCREDRSFHYHGKRLPVCARCTGELIGMVAALVCAFFYRCSPQLALVLMVPMVVDGFVQQLTSYESNNFKRLVTGVLFGFGLVMLIAISTVFTFRLGYEFGKGMR